MLLTALWSAHAHAYTEDAVIVIGTGGSRSAAIYDLQPYQDNHESPAETRLEAIPLGQRTLLSAELSLATFSDIKILPDGSHLLADASARGFLITDTNGKIRSELRPPGQVPLIASASAVSYLGPGEPLEVLMADNSTARASVYDIARQQYVWSHHFISASFQASIPAAIVLPNQKFAVAANWPALNLFAIDIFDQSNPEAPAHRRIANQHHSHSPDQLVIQPAIDDEIRDLTARIDGSLLVTTRFSVHAIAPDGQILWTFHTATSSDVAGELASARWLPSGRIALASFEPGHWTQPHTNHRIHWLETSHQDTPQIVATSDVLTTAPVRLDALHGHGATGTFGFHGDGEIAIGDAAQLTLSVPLTSNHTHFATHQWLQAEATLYNPTAELITLERAQIIGVPGPCDSPAGPARILSAHPALYFEPDAEFSVHAEVQLDETFAPGPWCLHVSARDRFLIDRTFENPVEILLDAPAEADAGPHIPDAGISDLEDPIITILDQPDAGCACNTNNPRPTSTHFLLSLIVFCTFLRQRIKVRATSSVHYLRR